MTDNIMYMVYDCGDDRNGIHFMSLFPPVVVFVK